MIKLLTIENITFLDKPYKSLDLLEKYLTSRLTSANINFVLKRKINSIEFQLTPDKKLFQSNKINHVLLKDDDPRIQKNGRNYLETERLTEKQFNVVLKTFSEYLDQICVSCLIILHTDSGEKLVIRDEKCNNYLNKWPKTKQFPVEKI